MVQVEITMHGCLSQVTSLSLSLYMAGVWLLSMAGSSTSEILQLALPERMLHVDCQVIALTCDGHASMHAHVTDMHACTCDRHELVHVDTLGQERFQTHQWSIY